jgi:hypothetical protein
VPRALRSSSPSQFGKGGKAVDAYASENQEIERLALPRIDRRIVEEVVLRFVFSTRSATTFYTPARLRKGRESSREDRRKFRRFAASSPRDVEPETAVVRRSMR